MELEENLQQEAGNQEHKNTHNNVEESVKSIEKTFTQKEVNEIVKSRLDRERKKYPNEEDLKAFTKWKESQQSEQEKYQELSSKYESLQKEYISYKNYNLVKNENVNELFVDFIIDKVSSQDGDFEENLKVFKKSNPQFFDTNRFIKMSTSPNLESNKKEESKKTVLKKYF